MVVAKVRKRSVKRKRHMTNPNPAFHGNQTPCWYCQAIFEHERWCPSRDTKVCYAYQIAADGSKITLGDALILHSLGVSWPECIHDFSFAGTGRARIGDL